VFVQPFVEEGLGNTAYLVGARDSKDSAVIDPLRDVDRYLEAADGLVAVDADDQPVAATARLGQQRDMAGMQQVKAAVRENDPPSVALESGGAIEQFGTADNLPHGSLFILTRPKP